MAATRKPLTAKAKKNVSEGLRKYWKKVKTGAIKRKVKKGGNVETRKLRNSPAGRKARQKAKSPSGKRIDKLRDLRNSKIPGTQAYKNAMKVKRGKSIRKLRSKKK